MAEEARTVARIRSACGKTERERGGDGDDNEKYGHEANLRASEMPRGGNRFVEARTARGGALLDIVARTRRRESALPETGAALAGARRPC